MPSIVNPPVPVVRHARFDTPSVLTNIYIRVTEVAVVPPALVKTDPKDVFFLKTDP
jgi:hypothetical protein